MSLNYFKKKNHFGLSNLEIWYKWVKDTFKKINLNFWLELGDAKLTQL